MSNFDDLHKHISTFITLSLADKKIVDSLFKETIFNKGSFFLKQGEVCNQLGFICNGIIRYYIEQEGEEQTYNFATEADFICNYDSMVRQTPSPKHIQAIENCKVFTISSKNLQRFTKKYLKGIFLEDFTWKIFMPI